MDSPNIRLTQTVQKGGCAAKIAATELRAILAKVQFPKGSPQVRARLLVDGATMDDAAIYKVNDELALVQTLDFFTPIVDTPSLFGKIAAANSLSDVYAMGGRPQTAMAILAFPLMTLSNEIIAEVLQGASDIIGESGSVFVGGHSIDDDTLKFGLSVTGFVHPKKVWTNAGAQPGDVLILTKPIGTGASTAALKRGLVDETGIKAAIESMSKLNNVIDFLSEDLSSAIHGATDLTGFGLAGHAMQMAQSSQVRFEIEMEKLPLLPNFREFIAEGCLTKAHRTNREYTQSKIQFNGFDPIRHLELFDPQTSGGLLLSVDPKQAQNVLSQITSGFSKAVVVGKVKEKTPEDGEFNLWLS